MAKTKISEFSATPGNNTDIDGINIAEGCAPSGINDAIRELMAQLKDFQTGAAGDSFNGPVGTTTAAAGAFTTLSASGSVTLSGGTANGVAYLNGSKVLTTGSALTFDGTNLGAVGSVAGTVQSSARNDNATTNAGAKLATFYSATEVTSLGHYWDGSQFLGKVNALGDLLFTRNNTEQMRLTSTGLGIGTSSPSNKLSVGSNGTSTISLDWTGDNSAKASYSANHVTGEVRLFATTNYFPTFYAGNAERMRLSTDGNLGLGVTPSAWGSSYKSLQMGGRANFASGALTQPYVTYNAYHNGTSWTYVASTVATSYESGTSGEHRWFNAPAGTAGNAISFTQAMTLTASGNLGVGATNPDSYSARLVAYGTGTGLYIDGKSSANTTSDIQIRRTSSGTGILAGPNIYMEDGTANNTVAIQNGAGNLQFWNYGAGSWNERARIDSSGNFIQTVNTTAATLTTNQTMTISIVNNSTLKFSVRGSDGTTRSATLVLV